MKVKFMRISPVAFIGSDGQEVNGQYFYYKSILGGDVRRFFMTNAAVLRLAVMPELGVEYYLIFNDAGKVVDVIDGDAF